MRTLVLPVTAHVIGGCGQLGGVESDDDHVIYCHKGREREYYIIIEDLLQS